MGLAATDGDPEREADGASDADPEAVPEADASGEPDALPDPLGATDALGRGIALGVGKMLLGMLANERAKISTKMTKTTITQGRARLSVRGGRAPR